MTSMLSIVKLNGGNLSKLHRLAIAPHVETLMITPYQVKNGTN